MAEGFHVSDLLGWLPLHVVCLAGFACMWFAWLTSLAYGMFGWLSLLPVAEYTMGGFISFPLVCRWLSTSYNGGLHFLVAGVQVAELKQQHAEQVAGFEQALKQKQEQVDTLRQQRTEAMKAGALNAKQKGVSPPIIHV